MTPSYIWQMGYIRSIEDIIATMQKTLQEQVISVQHFKYRGMDFMFKIPYKLSYVIDGSYYIHENEALGIIISEEKLSDLVNSFYDYFSFLWIDYAEENDDKLSKDAIELKNVLLGMCEVAR